MASYSFDVVSEFDQQELVNAVDQAQREIKTRYDLKDTNTTLELSDGKIVINASSDMSLDAARSVLGNKAAKRQISLKTFEYGKRENASGARVRQEITLISGIEKELAKKISKATKEEFRDRKIQVSIQGDSLRVTGKSKDDLQAVMQFLRNGDWPAPLQFNNYR